MNRLSIFFLPLFLLFISCTADMEQEVMSDYPNTHLLLDAAELHEKMQNENIFLIDARAELNENIIPGAIHFAAVSSLIDQDNPVEFFLVGPDEFQELMRGIGLNNDDRVVIYDDGNALAAARLFYALDYYGFSNASVLNGGIQGWLDADMPVEQNVASAGEGNFNVDIQEGLTCDFNYIQEAANSPDKIIFDARSQEEYTGEDKRALKGGHIPNAVNLEWNSVLRSDGVPYFKTAAEIQAQYTALGITPDKEVIPHCHTNVRGSHAYFTLRLMGYDSVRPYEGSWSEYGNREDAVSM